MNDWLYDAVMECIDFETREHDHRIDDYGSIEAAPPQELNPYREKQGKEKESQMKIENVKFATHIQLCYIKEKVEGD